MSPVRRLHGIYLPHGSASDKLRHKTMHKKPQSCRLTDQLPSNSRSNTEHFHWLGPTYSSCNGFWVEVSCTSGSLRGNTVTMKFSLSVAFLLLVSGTVSARGSLFDGFFGRGSSSGQAKPEPTKPTDPKPTKIAGGNADSRFRIDYALRPAVAPSAGCNLELVQKLNKIIENQDDELRLLKQLTAPKSRFYGRS
ncbi:uncharacterized protein [Pseudochaenichthys georgianus]|uniref:uncharacterized protein isoform X2 n=1 Tax=Pseudochaenichthys georgianus TaxID=52239 RepID=UPI00146AEC66|nr:uncharacterized protein LOC117458761 isoform X2 [Pseudochaenichthys georgianus]